MTRRRVLCGLFVFAAVWPKRLRAGGDVIVVIVHKSNPVSRLGPDDLRPIYLLNKTSWPNGQPIEPFNLPEESSARVSFDRAVLGLEPDEVARYWIDRRIRGDARPPRKVPSPGTILAMVTKHQGAIGYIPISELNSTVKAIARVDGKWVVAP